MRQVVTFGIASLLWTFAGGPALATESPEFGRVSIPKGMTIEMRRSLVGNEGPALLPPGSYSLYHWSIGRTDAQGHQWKCEGVIPESQRVLQVVKEGQTAVPVGEPLVCTLTAVRRGSEFTFTYALAGHLGESVSIYKDEGQRQVPKLRLKNADGSYDQTLAFGYG